MDSKAKNTNHSAAFSAGAAAAPAAKSRAGAPNEMSQQLRDGNLPAHNTDLRGASNKFYDKEGVPSIPKASHSV